MHSKLEKRFGCDRYMFHRDVQTPLGRNKEICTLPSVLSTGNDSAATKKTAVIREPTMVDKNPCTPLKPTWTFQNHVGNHLPSFFLHLRKPYYNPYMKFSQLANKPLQNQKSEEKSLEELYRVARSHFGFPNEEKLSERLPEMLSWTSVNKISSVPEDDAPSLLSTTINKNISSSSSFAESFVSSNPDCRVLQEKTSFTPPPTVFGPVSMEPASDYTSNTLTNEHSAHPISKPELQENATISSTGHGIAIEEGASGDIYYPLDVMGTKPVEVSTLEHAAGGSFAKLELRDGKASVDSSKKLLTSSSRKRHKLQKSAGKKPAATTRPSTGSPGPSRVTLPG